MRATAELKRVDLSCLSRQEKIALFINLYNALVIHAFVVQGPPNTLWKRYKVVYKTVVLRVLRSLLSLILGGSQLRISAGLCHCTYICTEIFRLVEGVNIGNSYCCILDSL